MAFKLLLFDLKCILYNLKIEQLRFFVFFIQDNCVCFFLNETCTLTSYTRVNRHFNGYCELINFAHGPAALKFFTI